MIKVLFVSDHAFFLKRNKQNGFEDPACWSVQTLKEVSDKWDLVLVLGNLQIEEPCAFGGNLRDLCNKFKFHNVEVIDDTKSRMDILEIMKKCIINMGGKMRFVKNIKEITYYNIYRCFENIEFRYADANDHSLVGVKVDKPKSFLEFAKERKQKAVW